MTQDEIRTDGLYPTYLYCLFIDNIYVMPQLLMPIELIDYKLYAW